MSRYSRGQAPRAYDWDDDAPLIPQITVDEHVAVETGLLWADGQPIWREPNPIGFGKDEQW